MPYRWRHIVKPVNSKWSIKDEEFVKLSAWFLAPFFVFSVNKNNGCSRRYIKPAFKDTVTSRVDNSMVRYQDSIATIESILCIIQSVQTIHFVSGSLLKLQQKGCSFTFCTLHLDGSFVQQHDLFTKAKANTTSCFTGTKKRDKNFLH